VVKNEKNETIGKFTSENENSRNNVDKEELNETAFIRYVLDNL